MYSSSLKTKEKWAFSTASPYFEQYAREVPVWNPNRSFRSPTCGHVWKCCGDELCRREGRRSAFVNFGH